MNELFQFHKELNTKKIIIVIAIIILLIFLIFFIPKRVKNIEEKKIEDSQPNTTFLSNDESIRIELSKEYGFSKYISTQDYILELRSPDNIDIFVSRKNLIENRDLNTVVSTDRNSYINKFSTYSNLSDIAELTIAGNPAYSYSFHYLDNKTAYYLQIIWIQTETGYYIIDVEFPLDTLNTNYKVINDLLTALIFINKEGAN